MHLGRLALAHDAPEKAVLFFSKARSISPTDLHAQLFLAEAFARNGKVRRAEAYLTYLLKQPEQKTREATYLAALSRLKKNYPFVTSASFAALPSTNIKNTSSQTQWGQGTIPDGGQEVSGIGLALSANGRYRHPVSDGLTFELGTTLQRIWYSEEDLRYWPGRITADLVWLDAHREMRIGLHGERIYYSDTDPTPRRRRMPSKLGLLTSPSPPVVAGRLGAKFRIKRSLLLPFDAHAVPER